MNISHSIAVVGLGLVVGLSAGCGKKNSEKNQGGNETAGGGATTPPEQAASGPDFSSWDMNGKKGAWQGSWLAKDNGRIQAWTVAGDKVQTWDGEKENSYTLEIEAPCRAAFASEGGMKEPRNFSVVDGKLRYGAGGYRRGKEAIFCDDSGSIYTVDASGACTLWKRDFGDFKKERGECGFKAGADGAEVFFHGDPNSGEFPVQGDAIVPRASFPTEAVEGDFAAAKAARDAKAAE